MESSRVNGSTQWVGGKRIITCVRGLLIALNLLVIPSSLRAATVNVDQFTSVPAAIAAAGEEGTLIFTAGKVYTVCETLYPLTGQRWIGNQATIRRCAAVVTRLTRAARKGDTSIEVESTAGYNLGMEVTPVLKSVAGHADGEGEGKHPITAITTSRLTFTKGLQRDYPVGSYVTSLFSQIKVQTATPGVVLENLIMDGNRTQNNVYVSWTANHALNANAMTTVTGVTF